MPAEETGKEKEPADGLNTRTQVTIQNGGRQAEER
jgi:hypothetical protein